METEKKQRFNMSNNKTNSLRFFFVFSSQFNGMRGRRSFGGGGE